MAASEPSIESTQPQTPKALLQALQREFRVMREFLPLAIGIDKQILASKPETPRKLLRIALGMHTKSVRYLKNLQTAQTRFNLDESPADPVSDEQRALAATTLHTHFKKLADQRKAELAAEKAAKAAREHAEKLRQLQEKFSRNNK